MQQAADLQQARAAPASHMGTFPQQSMQLANPIRTSWERAEHGDKIWADSKISLVYELSDSKINEWI